MTRSIWKGPFVDGYMLKKAAVARESGSNAIIKIMEPSLYDPAAICWTDIWCPQWS